MIKFWQFLNYFTAYLLLIYICNSNFTTAATDKDETIEATTTATKKDNAPAIISTAVNKEEAEETTITELPPEGPEPEEGHYDICDIPFLGNTNAIPVPENLARIGPNSKYFIMVGVESVPIKEVAPLCASVGLQPAEVQHNVDLLTIELYLLEHAPRGIILSLGLNDEKNEGSFVEVDGTPMQFHQFDERQPNNMMNVESCITVSESPTFRHLVYNDVTCDTGVTPICMFNITSECYLGSPDTMARLKGGFEMVGSSSVRDYYVASHQYPREEAVAVCEKAGYKLADFSTGSSNNQMLYDWIKKWLERNFIFPAIPFWTGGQIVEKETAKPKAGEAVTPQYKFEHSGKLLNDLSAWPSLAWDANEPSDSSGLGLEKCISAVLYKPYQSSGDNVFTLAATNCRLPQYPLCYEEKTVGSVNVTAANITAALATGTGTASTNGSLGGRSDFSDDEDLRPGRFCTIADIKLNLSSSQLSTVELLDLAAASRVKHLDSDQYRVSWKLEKEWLITVTEKIFKIPKQFCPSSFLPSEYINVMHNLIILYYNSVISKLEEPSAGAKIFLKEQGMIFEKCTKSLSPLQFDSAGGLPTFFGSSSIKPIEETIDNEDITGKIYAPDMIIDTFWYMFQITIAACWTETKPGGFPSRTFNLQRIHYLFSTYFLEVFQERWFSSKTEVDYGVILGDVDVDSAYYSMKACARAAFIKSNISELYFPRPVYIQGDRSDILNEKFQNLEDEPDIIIS